MSREGALWMGGLEPYMDETFIMNAFEAMGERNVVSIKLMRNKFTTDPVSYGFVNFNSDPAAIMAMHKLNGKVIPNTQPTEIFRLSSASSGPLDPEDFGEYPIWITNLTADVNQVTLSKVFTTRYKSVRMARVMRESGIVQGAIVVFGSVSEQRDSIVHMNGFQHLGFKPIKVFSSLPGAMKMELDKNPISGSDFDDLNWWSPKSEKETQKILHEELMSGRVMHNHIIEISDENIIPRLQPKNSNMCIDIPKQHTITDKVREGVDQYILVDHKAAINIDILNTHLMSRSLSVWEEVDKDRWIFEFGDEDGSSYIPDFSKKQSAVQAS